MPVTLSALPAIRTAQSDKNADAHEFLQFHISKAARIYVAYDADAQNPPEWLRMFTPEKMTIEVDQIGTARLFNVFSRIYPAGPIILGGNRAAGSSGNVFMNYLVIIRLTG